jgi:hypothetical protein
MHQSWSLDEIIKAAQQPSDFATDFWRKMLYGQYTLEVSCGPNNIAPRSFQSHEFENALEAAAEPLAAGYTLRLSGPNGLNLNTEEIRLHLRQLNSRVSSLRA